MPRKTVMDRRLSAPAFWGFSERTISRERLFHSRAGYFLCLPGMYPLLAPRGSRGLATRLTPRIFELVDKFFSGHNPEKIISFFAGCRQIRTKKKGDFNFPLSPLTL